MAAITDLPSFLHFPPVPAAPVLCRRPVEDGAVFHLQIMAATLANNVQRVTFNIDDFKPDRPRAIKNGCGEPLTPSFSAGRGRRLLVPHIRSIRRFH